jgi:hypothetical protein
VVLANHLEKSDGVRKNGTDDIPYMMENNPFMFETTNQYLSSISRIFMNLP